MNRYRIAALVACQILALVLNGIAGLEIPSIFSDHMVLQRDRPLTVWGWAVQGDVVTLEFSGSTDNATASADGLWEMVLPSFPASADGRDPEPFFLVVQLHGYDHPNRLADWSTLREQQAEVVQSTHRAAMAVTIDLGDQSDFHPVRKQPVGERLALLARRHVYGEESVVAEAPRFVRAERHGDEVTLHFKPSADLATSDEMSPRGFEMGDGKQPFVEVESTLREGVIVFPYLWELQRPKSATHGPTGPRPIFNPSAACQSLSSAQLCATNL